MVRNPDQIGSNLGGKVAVLTWFKVLPQPCGRLPTSNGSHLGHMRNPSRINKSATARGVYDPIAGSWLAWQSKRAFKSSNCN